MALTAKERHARWIAKPGNKERRAAASKAWALANPDRARELKKKPETLANKKAHRQRPEVKAAERLRDRARLRNPLQRASRFLSAARGRAAKFGVPFALTIEEVQTLMAPGFCPYTGVRFDFTGPLAGLRKNPWSPSIDRVEPSLGYVAGNVEIVSTWYNLAKNQWPPEVMRTAIVGLKRTYRLP